MTQYIILAIAAAVIFILLIVIIVLAVKGRKKKDDSFEDDKANQNEENENQEIRDAAVAQEILAIEEALVMGKTIDKEEEEDEFEIEFYEIEEQIEAEIEEKQNILGKNAEVTETEEYLEISVTYEVIENIGMQEKIEIIEQQTEEPAHQD